MPDNFNQIVCLTPCYSSWANWSC